MSEANPRRVPTDRPSPTLQSWMGDVDPSRIGFPFAVDKTSYQKRTGIPYKDTPEGPLHVDAYLPNDVERPPLVVMIHGGGWRQGGRYQMGLTKWAGYLASSGLAVVSIDYRLSGVACYPTPFQDCLDAMDWIVEGADALGVDASRIGLWGDSAGGHLVLLLSTSQTRAEFTGPRMRTDGARIAAVVAWYPPTDLEALARMAVEGGRVEVSDFVGVEPGSDPDRWREVSPYHQAHAQAPPSLVLQGTRDLLVPHRQARAYADKLREMGASHELHIVEGGVHGFERVDPGDEAKGLIEYSREFLRKHLI